MPATTTLTVEQLVHRIQQAELMDRGVLTEVLESFRGNDDDSASLCEHLVKSGHLTRWQCDRLLEGRRKFLLGKYRLLDQLGRGGMSRVYLAEHTVMHRRVAIKILSPQHAADPEYLGRFFVEARAVASLDHPHVVRAYDVDHVDNYHFLVMEYLEGRDVFDMVVQDGPMPSQVAAKYIQQAADGLAHAHKAGLIHRDVKPGNLFIDKNGVLKVLDLGLAYFTTEQRVKLPDTDEEMVVGTVDFIAPEQALGRKVDERTDVYSLGATLYYMLTGSIPFPDGTVSQKLQQQIKAQPKPIRELNPSVGVSLEAICRRMMSKSPKARYATMAEVSEVISAWLSGKSVNSSGYVVDHADLNVDELVLAPVDEAAPKPAPPPPRPASKPASSTKAPVAIDTSTMPQAAPASPVQDLSARVELPGTSAPGDLDHLLTCDLKVLDRSSGVHARKRPAPIVAAKPDKESLFAKPMTYIIGAVVVVIVIAGIAAAIMLM